jgi:hypothetical protein
VRIIITFAITFRIYYFLGSSKGDTAMQYSVKYVVRTDGGKTYILHIMDAAEFNSHYYVGMFLYHDEEVSPDSVDLPVMRHRVLFERSVNAILDKVIEYTSGRNEKIEFLEMHAPLAA